MDFNRRFRRREVRFREVQLVELQNRRSNQPCIPQTKNKPLVLHGIHEEPCKPQYSAQNLLKSHPHFPPLSSSPHCHSPFQDPNTGSCWTHRVLMIQTCVLSQRRRLLRTHMSPLSPCTCTESPESVQLEKTSAATKTPSAPKRGKWTG